MGVRGVCTRPGAAPAHTPSARTNSCLATAHLFPVTADPFPGAFLHALSQQLRSSKGLHPQKCQRLRTASWHANSIHTHHSHASSAGHAPQHSCAAEAAVGAPVRAKVNARLARTCQCTAHASIPHITIRHLWVRCAHLRACGRRGLRPAAYWHAKAFMRQSHVSLTQHPWLQRQAPFPCVTHAAPLAHAAAGAIARPRASPTARVTGTHIRHTHTHINLGTHIRRIHTSILAHTHHTHTHQSWHTHQAHTYTSILAPLDPLHTHVSWHTHLPWHGLMLCIA